MPRDDRTNNRKASMPTRDGCESVWQTYSGEVAWYGQGLNQKD